MTDGRAITGMTADSHARSNIPAFFSPGISIFFQIAHSSRFLKSEHRAGRARPVLRERDVTSPRFSTSTAAHDRAAGGMGGTATSNKAFDPFDFLYEFLAPFNSRLLNNCRRRPCVPSVSYITLSRLSSFSFLPSLRETAFISSRHRQVITGYSTVGNTYLHRKIVRAPVIRSSRISIFRWTECLRYWQSRRSRLIVDVPKDRIGGFCAAVRAVNSRATRKRNRSSRGSYRSRCKN